MKNKNTDTLLLDDSYKNVRMGTYAIDCIIEKIDNKKLEDLLRKQNRLYLEWTTRLEDFAKTNEYEIKDISGMLKASSFMSINMKTMMDKSTSHIAQMLIEGTTMGIVTLIKELKENPTAKEELKELAKEIISSQEKFVESLKKFL